MTDLNINNSSERIDNQSEFSNEFAMYIDYLAEKRREVDDLLN